MRKSIKIDPSIYEKLCILADQLNKSISSTIGYLLKNANKCKGCELHKINIQLKAKLENLEKTQKAGDAGDTRNTITTSPLEYECYFMAFDPEQNKLFCDGKEINKYVCMNRHSRYAAMGIRCRPKERTKKPKRPRRTFQKRKSNWDNDDWGYIPEGNRGNIYRGEA